MLLHPWWAVLGVYAIAAFVSGIVLSVVFQLAHCVEGADFPVPAPAGPGGPGGGGAAAGRLGTDWAVHQVQTTVDFARGNRVLCWLLGGLNFQVEHHLFAKVCHVHYPALSAVVEEGCREFGVRYAAHASFCAALRSHYRWLVQMGRPTAG
jgi:linoleoyl-CoA desaturase